MAAVGVSGSVDCVNKRTNIRRRASFKNYTGLRRGAADLEILL
jgi:hypothetical protein